MIYVNLLRRKRGNEMSKRLLKEPLPSDALFLVIVKSLSHMDVPFKASNIQGILEDLGYSSYRCSYIKERVNNIGGKYRRIL